MKRSLAPTPWLLPRGTKLAYSGLENDLDALLRLQSTHSLTGYPAVTMIFFNYHHRTMLMNCIYSLIKFAGGFTLGRRAEVGYDL